MKTITLGYLLASARISERKSQEHMAFELGVARKTIQNWENDVTSPSIDQAINYYKTLGLSPIPYLFRYVFPDTENDDKSKREELKNLVELLPDKGVEQLLNLLKGEHGSSPRAVLDLVSAHLETPMKDRIMNASIIIKNYEMAVIKNKQIGNISVDKQFLDKALEEAEKSFIEDKKAYVMDRHDSR